MTTTQETQTADQQPVLETLALTVNGKVLEVALNRPDKSNAMNAVLWRELQIAFEWADTCDAVRVVILHGHGKNFCGGLDLAMIGDFHNHGNDPARTTEYFRRHILGLQDNLSAIEKCRKPVLAAVHGAVIGGAIDMITCCDMRYAAEGARFSVFEVNVAMVADVGTLQRLPRLIPEGVARELAYTGRVFDSQEAHGMGLVNRVFDSHEALLDGVRELAADIAQKTPLVTRGIKEVMNFSREHSIQDGLNFVATWNAGIMSQVDLKEVMEAKAERRAPHFED
ncbi:crotonase/enoyl-CoA hydratase family protein [Paraglaciecola sp.]|nr:crotonase/enoyl-CoA hydratase family protein [Paraglaciecola sp.]MDB4281750.1 crotonase/enoyl-CoA hydratase family protein [Paraglaciecola sp.]